MSKKVRSFHALFASAVVMLVASAPAGAANFEPGSGTYFVDTTALTLTGPGTNVQGTNQGGVAVFSFDAVSIPGTAEIEVEGARPFKLVATGDLTLAGVIDGSGFSATDFGPGPIAGGPGGAAGGALTTNPGQGPGGGGAASAPNSGGGGGGFGGVGASGGNSSGTGGVGGSAYGDLNAFFQGGSGGAGGAVVGGGGGGGAVALFGSNVRIVSGAEVLADGGGGAVGAGGASGGGSGGAILLHAENGLQMDGLLSAAGGEGGGGGCCGAGGGGGGGRIALQYRGLNLTGSSDVSGGTSGTRSTTPCCAGGPLGDPAGAAGVVTQTQLPAIVTPPPAVVVPPAAPKPSCVVPKLKGKKVPVARKALRNAHCAAGKVKRSFSAKVKNGRVIKQSAKVGKVLPTGAKIGLTVSKGEGR